MRILIFGGGSVGTALFGKCHGSDDVVWLNGRAKCDITNAMAVLDKLTAEKPDLVINAAGYTDVDGAEEEREIAMAVNGLGPRHIASACREVGAKLIHISTDMVFGDDQECPEDGWPEDAPIRRPVNYYGQTKLEGEKAVEQHLGGSLTGQYCIVRTSWILGNRGWLPWAVKMAGTLVQDKTAVIMPTRSARPTLAADLASAIVGIADVMLDKEAVLDLPPILHFANHGEIARHRLLQAVDCLINPPDGSLSILKSSGRLVSAHRADRSTLDCDLYESLFGCIPHWAAGFSGAIEALR